MTRAVTVNKHEDHLSVWEYILLSIYAQIPKGIELYMFLYHINNILDLFHFHFARLAPENALSVTTGFKKAKKAYIIHNFTWLRVS